MPLVCGSVSSMLASRCSSHNRLVVLPHSTASIRHRGYWQQLLVSPDVIEDSDDDAIPGLAAGQVPFLYASRQLALYGRDVDKLEQHQLQCAVEGEYDEVQDEEWLATVVGDESADDLAFSGPAVESQLPPAAAAAAAADGYADSCDGDTVFDMFMAQELGLAPPS